VRAKKNAIKHSYEKESAVSLIKKFVMHLWNPEIGYLNKQLLLLHFFRIMDCVIAILDGIFLLLL
jgi:hypothetical protein